MIEKIHVDELRVGMYIVDSGLSWLDHPFLYSEEGLVATERQIERIRKEGFSEVFVDPDRSTNKPRGKKQFDSTEEELNKRMAAFKPSKSSPRRPRNKVSVRKELTVAKRLYSDAVSYAREFLSCAKTGHKLDMDKSEAFVEKIIDSVSRNMDALISLSKLRVLDEYTFTHCVNVAVLSVVFGRFLGLPSDDLRGLGMAGLFHDLGKAKAPPKVLNKPGRLTPEEFEIIKRHPSDGFLLLQERGAVDDLVLSGVAEHHEKYSGEGYPSGLKGDGISPYARILSVADVYDALTSTRVYRKGMPGGKAMSVMYSMREKDFYPFYVEHFIKCIGVYPVGALVQLSNGYLAVVAEANPDDMLRPAVVLAMDPRGRAISPKPLDLASSEAGGLKIQACLDPADYRLDPGRYLM